MINHLLFTLLLLIGVVTCAYQREVITLEQRIFGGNDASVGQFPFMVSLRIYFRDRWIHVCGGAIITEKWILTAAHCLRSRTKDDIKVYMNTITTNGDGDVYEPELLIMHEEFSLKPVRHDVGLIKLNRNITLNANVQPIRISQEHVDENVVGTASGWGFYKENSIESPEILKYLNQTTITDADCFKALNSSENLYDANLCAYNSNGIGMCNGDSGSPLIANKQQIGIASWVKFPCASGHPDVYVRTSDYLNWISLKVYSN